MTYERITAPWLQHRPDLYKVKVDGIIIATFVIYPWEHPTDTQIQELAEHEARKAKR